MHFFLGTWTFLQEGMGTQTLQLHSNKTHASTLKIEKSYHWGWTWIVTFRTHLYLPTDSDNDDVSETVCGSFVYSKSTCSNSVQGSKDSGSETR